MYATLAHGRRKDFLSADDAYQYACEYAALEDVSVDICVPRHGELEIIDTIVPEEAYDLLMTNDEEVVPWRKRPRLSI